MATLRYLLIVVAGRVPLPAPMTCRVCGRTRSTVTRAHARSMPLRCGRHPGQILIPIISGGMPAERPMSWVERFAVWSGLRVPQSLECSACERPVRSLDRVQAEQYAEMGWLPCSCGGTYLSQVTVRDRRPA